MVDKGSWLLCRIRTRINTHAVCFTFSALCVLAVKLSYHKSPSKLPGASTGASWRFDTGQRMTHLHCLLKQWGLCLPESLLEYQGSEQKSPWQLTLVAKVLFFLVLRITWSNTAELTHPWHPKGIIYMIMCLFKSAQVNLVPACVYPQYEIYWPSLSSQNTIEI